MSLRKIRNLLPKRVELTNVAYVFANAYGLLLPLEALSSIFIRHRTKRIVFYTKGPVKTWDRMGTTVIPMSPEMGVDPIELAVNVVSVIPGHMLKVGDLVHIMNMFHIHPNLDALYVCEVRAIIDTVLDPTSCPNFTEYFEEGRGYMTCDKIHHGEMFDPDKDLTRERALDNFKELCKECNSGN